MEEQARGSKSREVRKPEGLQVGLSCLSTIQQGGVLSLDSSQHYRAGISGSQVVLVVQHVLRPFISIALGPPACLDPFKHTEAKQFVALLMLHLTQGGQLPRHADLITRWGLYSIFLEGCSCPELLKQEHVKYQGKSACCYL